MIWRIILHIITTYLFIFSISATGQSFQKITEELNLEVGFTDSDRQGSGLSFFDFNQDGWDDLTYAREDDSVMFYLNNQGVLQRLIPNIPVLGNNKQVLWCDLDNDSDMDIIATSFGGFNNTNGDLRLFINTGDFEFVDFTEEAGLYTHPQNYYGVAAGDYNRDGLLDLYVSVLTLSTSNSDSLARNQLYKNLGDGTFQNVTSEAGMVPIINEASFDAMWIDYDNNLWPDLYVINDRVPFRNNLYHNNGDGTFTDVAIQANAEFAGQNPMTITAADFDNDQDIDIYMTNIGLVTNNQLFSPGILVNQNDGSFVDEITSLGLNHDRYSWGALWCDFNNNGWQDLYVCTSPISSSCRIFEDLVYTQDANTGSFTEASSLFNGLEVQRTYSVAKGDLNNDGYYDIATHAINPYSSHFWLNSGGENNFVKISLEGTFSNRMAIGSWIKVFDEGITLTHYTACGENYVSQDSQHHIFGLGEDNPLIDSIKVTYLSGHIDSYYNLPTDTHYFFIEGETYVAEISSPQGTSLCLGDSLILNAGTHSSYLWSTGDTSSTILVTEPGFYSVEVSSDIGIVATAEIEITENPSPWISANIIHLSCFESGDGSIALFNQTGIEASQVEWTHGEFGVSIDSLEAGMYSFLFIDENGCEAEGTYQIIQPSAMDVIATSIPQSEEPANGEVNFFILGGTPPYTVTLEGDTVQSPLTGLEAGTYDFVVYDDNDCELTFEVTVSSILGIESTEEVFAIWPNPIHNSVEIQSQKRVRELRVYDITGAEVLVQTMKQSSKVNLSGLTPGIYLFKLVFEDGSEGMKRMIKR
jgi:hypothetical protein